MYILKECDINIIHNTSNFEIFYKDYFENNLIKYNMQIKKFQKYYVRSLYFLDISNDINNIITNFKIKFNFNINLTKNEIYKEKYYVTGPINNLDNENL